MDSEQVKPNRQKRGGANPEALQSIGATIEKQIAERNLTKRPTNNNRVEGEALPAEKGKIPGWLFHLKKIGNYDEEAYAKGKYAAINPFRLEKVRDDLNDQIVIGKRAENQQAIEDNVSTTFHLPFSERMKKIRPLIFRNIPTKYGEKINDIRTTEVGGGSLQTAQSTYMREVLLPHFERQIDSLYQQVMLLPQAEREKAALRLASHIYATGIMLHPYSDGNGQTFKMLAVSYLHDLGGDVFRDKYFPKKSGYQKNNADGAIRTDIPGVVKIDPIYQERLPLIEAEITNQYLAIPYWKESARQQVAQQLQQNFEKEFIEDKEKMSPAEAEQRYKRKQRALYDAQSTKAQKRINAYLDFIINADEGKEFTENLILGKETARNTQASIFDPYKVQTIKISHEIQDSIENLLESRPQ